MSFVHDPGFTSWGPFIRHDVFLTQPVTRSDLITAGVAFGFVSIFACSAAFVGINQTRRSQQPWKSPYLWMIWLEWAACIVIGVEAILYLLRVIRPSFYFFMSLRTYLYPNPRHVGVLIVLQCWSGLFKPNFYFRLLSTASGSSFMTERRDDGS
jgi:hypothetical protein